MESKHQPDTENALLIKIDQDWQCRWWSKRLGVPPERLRAAVRAVGPRVSRVREHLTKLSLTKMPEEKRTQWNFEINNDQWLWKCTAPSGITTVASRTFPTMKDCVDDAKRHGYVPWTTEAERRRPSQN